MVKKICQIILLIAVGALAITCVEPFEVETEVFEDALVVDATITDEMKRQLILLNRAYLLEEFNPIPEENADVRIIDNQQNEYIFQEIAPGQYVSINEFAAQNDRNYQLLITTSNGRSYTSKTEQLPEFDPIENLSAIRTANENDQDGMAIIVNFRSSENPKYYRYEYEETYKIIAPQWKGERVVSFFPQVITFPIEGQEHICYNSNTSEGINNASTVSSTGDRVNQFIIRFIKNNNYIISHRYSILVKQFAISKAANEYFDLLRKFSGQGNLLSQTQPGFFNGNISSEANSSDKVLGFFDVSSVSTKRIYFNYADFFPNEALPPYTDSDCAPFVAGFGTSPTVSELLNNNIVRFYLVDPLTGEISVVPRECADCTVMGSPEVPEFWED